MMGRGSSQQELQLLSLLAVNTLKLTVKEADWAGYGARCYMQGRNT